MKLAEFVPTIGRATDQYNFRKDDEEILTYIAQNGPCSSFDIELCCHQGRYAVMNHLAGLRKAGKVARTKKGYVAI